MRGYHMALTLRPSPKIIIAHSASNHTLLIRSLSFKLNTFPKTLRYSGDDQVIMLLKALVLRLTGWYLLTKASRHEKR